MGESRHPVVTAGLLGAASVALALPEAASALPLTQTIDEALVSPTMGLVVGAAGGALLTGAAVAVAALARRRGHDDEPRIEPAARPPRHLRAEQPSARVASEDAGARRGAPSHAATNYEDIAENYVGRASFRQRMARRAEGVAATLRDRMGASMMDGLPVIARADGSVGDVGTTWWRNAVGADTIIHDSGFAVDDTAPAIAIPSDFEATDRDRLIAAERRPASIASRVAFVDEGAYPEHRTLDDLDESDVWERALRSLDEKIATVAPAQDPIGFIDNVGGPDSLDEPDNLEPQTAFIPFKAPGGHPEVVDTETYVDYLIEDEFSKNSSTAARRSSRRFLQLLEGGTQPTGSRHLTDQAPQPAYSGRHFAAPRAAEA